MDSLLDALYDKYEQVFKDLVLGYPISEDDIKEMWAIIHKRHFVNFENDAPLIFSILEYYEHM